MIPPYHSPLFAYSLGAMCHKGWRTSHLNPAGMRIVCREKAHNDTGGIVGTFSIRGGPGSGHHVDVLGNTGVLADILAVVSGHGEGLQDEYFSEIAAITKDIDFGN